MNYYYVCDRCATFSVLTEEIDDDSGWTCENCGSNAVWEFTRRDAAEHHARHILRGIGSGLFRKVAQ